MADTHGTLKIKHGDGKFSCFHCGTEVTEDTQESPECGRTFGGISEVSKDTARSARSDSGGEKSSNSTATGCVVLVAILVAVGGFLLFRGCLSSIGQSTKPAYHRVTYRVTGSARDVFIHYRFEDEAQQQESGRSLPWSKSFRCESGDWLYLDAQNGASRGSITAKIIIDGTEWRTATSSGGYVSVNVNGSCPREVE